MKSKHYITFLNHVHQYQTDVELADVVNIAITQSRLNSATDGKLFIDMNDNQHPKLSKKANCNKNRILTIRHLKATVYETFLKEIYEEVTQYLRSILRTAAIKGFEPGRLVGDNNDIVLNANMILSAGDWETIANLVADNILQKLESERSTLTLIKKINTKLALDVNQIAIDEALPFLEARHFLVHADGVVTDEFISKYPEIPVDTKKRIDLNYSALPGFLWARFHSIAESLA